MPGLAPGGDQRDCKPKGREIPRQPATRICLSHEAWKRGGLRRSLQDGLFQEEGRSRGDSLGPPSPLAGFELQSDRSGLLL
jgi:hypothetical protein